MEEAERLAEEAAEKEAERKEHIKAMEDMGYDMTEYKEETPVTSSEEEISAAKEEAERVLMGAEKASMAAGQGLQGKWTGAAQSADADACGEEDPQGAPGVTAGGLPGCNRQCKTCSRIHCRFRKENC